MDKIYKSKNKALSDLKNGALVWKYLSDNLKDDENFLLELVDHLNCYFLSKKIKNFFDYVSIRLQKDKNFILKICYKSPTLLYHADIRIVDDLEIALLLIDKMPPNRKDVEDILNCFTGRILDHQEVGMLIASKFPDYILHLGPTLLQQKNIMDIFVKLNPLYLEYVPDNWKNDKSFVLDVVQLDGNALNFASEQLKNDKDIVLAAVRNKGLSLSFASKILQDDEDVAYAAIRNNLYAIAYVSERIKGNEYLYVYNNVLFNGWKNSTDNVNFDNIDLTYIINHMPVEFKQDKKFFFNLVARNYRNVKYLTDDLKNDICFMTELVRKYPLCLQFFDKYYKNNKSIILEAVNSLGISLEYASTRLKNDKNIVLAAVKNQSSALAYASKKLQDDKDVVMVAVKKHGSAIEFASSRLQSNKEIYLTALESDAHVIRFLPEEVINDKEFFSTLFNKNHRCIVHLVDKIEYESFILKALEKLPYIIFYLGDHIRNRKFALVAIRNMALILGSDIKNLLKYFERFPEEIRDDEEIALFMFRKYHLSYQHFSKRLQDKFREFSNNDFIIYLEKIIMKNHLDNEMKEQVQQQTKIKI